MRRMWPEEFSALLDHAEEVNLSIPPAEGGGAKEPTTRKALKARITQDDFEKIWPLAEARYRLDGKFSGKGSYRCCPSFFIVEPFEKIHKPAFF